MPAFIGIHGSPMPVPDRGIKMSGLMRIIACLCGLLVTCTFVRAQGWRGIVPLHSSRQDVERVVGVPAESNGITYVLKNERVNVVYSNGKCGKVSGVGWNVPPGTVLAITVYPQVKRNLSDVRADLSGFEKYVNPHNPDIVYYNNEREGVSFGTRSGGEVFVIEYFPATADNGLRCPHSPRTPSGFVGDISPGRRLDEYADISFADEKLRLNNLALALQREPNMGTYIVAYADRRVNASEAVRRLRRAKKYLTDVKKIGKDRIFTKFGGRRLKASVELYIVPLEELTSTLYGDGLSPKQASKK